jgi:hypothetical protein
VYFVIFTSQDYGDCILPDGLMINDRILEVIVRFFTVFLMVTALLLIGCSSDKPTQTQNNQGSIYLNRLVVSMVPGRSDSVNVYATDADGTHSHCTISNSAPNIASATIIDSTLQITGLTCGVTNLTITNGSGKSMTLPVQVYDCHVLDTGEMFISYTDSFTYTFFYSYKPVPPPGFFAVGFAFGAEMPWPPNDPNGKQAVMVVKPKPGSDAIAFTDSFQSTSYPYMYGWTPIPPPGYVALGQVMPSDWNVRPDSVPCIREDLTTIADVSQQLATCHISSPANYYISFWKIDQPDAGSHPEAYLVPGTMVCILGTNPPPSDHPVAHVLKIDLPMLAEAPTQDFVPKLTSYENPVDATVPRLGKAMLVPCTIVNDLNYNQNVRWQIANSPFYVLERQVYYKLLYHYYNQGSVVQDNNVAMTSGITTTESQRIWNETEISLSTEVGLSFKAFSGKITATVSRKFGYESQTSVAELIQRTETQAVSTPPGKAAALWQQYNKYILYRHNGTDLEPVTSWEVGIHSFVEDEYPDN